MARYQFRMAGELGWQSNSGNALFALTNKPGSGKKITIRSFEITPLGSSNTGTAGTVSAAPPTFLTLARATVAGGVEVPIKQPADTDVDGWAYGAAHVLCRAAVSSMLPVARVAIAKQLNQASLSWFGRASALGRLNSTWRAAGKDASAEPLVVRPGEAVALYCSTLSNAIPLRVNATFQRTGTFPGTYSVTYYTSAIGADEAVFAIKNDAFFSDNVTPNTDLLVLTSVAVEEVGTYDSPYFQLVPTGAVISPDRGGGYNQFLVDNAFCDDPAPPYLPPIIVAETDVPVLPLGMPENALADGSTGSPKGFNYLKTKDFLGPVYRTLFPEYTVRPGTTGDWAPAGQCWHDAFVRRAGITLRPGEGIALVSGAETAAGATAAVGVSGWAPFEFAVVFDVEPILLPTLTITGLKNPSEVRVFYMGIDPPVELFGAENVTTGTFQMTYDPTEWPYNFDPNVTISILALGYQNIYLKDFLLSLTSDTTLPVQQTVDRQYANP